MDLRSVSDKELFQEFSRRKYCSTAPHQNIVFFGPPGSGKGTQTPKLSDEFCWCTLSTGDMLREAVSKKTELGKKADAIMKKGDLVPDDLVVGLIENKITAPECRYGVIFDGFPRTENQAKKLDELMQKRHGKIDKVFNFDIKDELLTERITGRRVHPASGRSYHVKFNPPKTENKDDNTGEPLIQRNDDKEDVLKKRLEAFHSQTTPVLNYYRQQNKLVNIDAQQSIDNIWDQLKNQIKY